MNARSSEASESRVLLFGIVVAACLLTGCSSVRMQRPVQPLAAPELDEEPAASLGRASEQSHRPGLGPGPAVRNSKALGPRSRGSGKHRLMDRFPHRSRGSPNHPSAHRWVRTRWMSTPCSRPCTPRTGNCPGRSYRNDSERRTRSAPGHTR